VITRAKLCPECIREVGPPTHADVGFLVYGIAEGETIVRQWNPDFAHHSVVQARKHLDEQPGLPCIHRVTPVDPTTSSRVAPDIWVRSTPKIDFARYAVDYAKVSCMEPA